jgi:hypothetical protein
MPSWVHASVRSPSSATLVNVTGPSDALAPLIILPGEMSCANVTPMNAGASVLIPSNSNVRPAPVVNASIAR